MNRLQAILFGAALGILAALCDVANAGGNNFNDRGYGPTAVINAAPITGGAVTAIVDTRGLTSIGLQLNVSSTSPAATALLLVDTSEDYSQSPAVAGNWTTLSFASQAATYANQVVPPAGTPAAVYYSATAGAVFYRDLTPTSAPYLRVRWVPTATPAGTVSVFVNGK